MEDKIDKKSEKKIKQTVKLADEIDEKIKKILDNKLYKKLETLCIDLSDINEASAELIKYIKEFNQLLMVDHEKAADNLVEIETELDHIEWHAKEAKPKISLLCNFLYGDK